MKTVKFIYPVFGHLIDHDDSVYDISADALSVYKEFLQNKIKEYQSDPECCGEGMEHYFRGNKDVESKLKSIVWSFEEFNKKLYGITIVELTDIIDEKGVKDLKDWISVQNSDGLGESFEQHIYDTDDGYRLSVSLWDSVNYFICTEEEFLLLTIESTEDSPRSIKPTCKLTDKDSNIFNLTEIARRTLVMNGQGSKANELCARVLFTSTSYSEALIIISEYVTIV